MFRKFGRRFLSLLLTVMMVLGAVPLSMSAAAAESWLWPVPGHREITAGYSSGHDSVEISDGDIKGASVVAAASGVVYKCPYGIITTNRKTPVMTGVSRV